MQWYSVYKHALHQIAHTQATELSYRPALDAMLKAAADELAPQKLEVLHEPRRTQYGAPDFAIRTTGGAPIGYVECKKPSENIESYLTSSQITKYSILSPNILLTNSYHFILLNDRAIIATGSEKTEITDILQRFFNVDALEIGNSEDLAQRLALRCHWFRDGLRALLAQDTCPPPLKKLLDVFRKEVSSGLSVEEFADTLAQTLIYGLLLARLNTQSKIDTLYVENYIPRSFALLRELINLLRDIDNYGSLKSEVGDVLALINVIDVAELSEDLSFRNGIQEGDDPYLYFYEDFLKAYEPQIRERRGVYYTPLPVVRFIVRATETILQQDFGISDGLADKRVTALDFATGTGTFMLEMMRRAFQNKAPALRELLLKDHLLPNFYGFELLIAPYAIAHLKLSQFLKERVRPLRDDEQLRIFITNTLEVQNADESQTPELMDFLPALSKDVQRAHAVKQQPVLIITGNPPYSSISYNKGPWIGNLIEDYKYVDGKPFGEKKHWLQDDYVKFIRFAQWKMDRVEQGIVAIITNHGFLDNPTFRGMRQSLMQSFDQLYLLDLHGNSKKNEVGPDGSKDENVFAIQQGVAISLMVKGPLLPKKVFHANLYGLREDKYRILTARTLADIKWKEIRPNTPFYLFNQSQVRGRSLQQYQKWRSVTDIFNLNVSGIVTARDHFAIAFTKHDLVSRVKRFCDLTISNEKIATMFNLKDTRGWKLAEARKKMANIDNIDDVIKAITYRPFDDRFILYHITAIDWGREKAMRHMLAGQNFGLVTVRQVKSGSRWQHCGIAINLVESTYISNKTSEICYNFPLYYYESHLNNDASERRENFNPAFRNWIDEHYGFHYSPEQILAVIYACLHSLDWRRRYFDFLCRDFPRIPFPKEKQQFERLASLGQRFIDLHVLKKGQGSLGELQGKGEPRVERIQYSPQYKRVTIDNETAFEPLPPAVWDFQVGGYQPLEKYLKSRKGRALTLDEVTTFRNAANAIATTIELMHEVDE